MTSIDPRVEEAAEALYQARRTRVPIPPISRALGITSPDLAYSVQEANTARWLGEGRKPTGRKIGLTSEAIQKQLGVGEPDYGMLWGDLGFEDGAAIPIHRFAQPRAEAEIAFTMSATIDSPNATMEDVTAAIGSVMAAVEIADSAIAGWKITLADTIADNASGGGYVLGRERRALADVDLEGCRMRLSLNRSPASQGVGSACLGNPLNAVMWLAKKMAEVKRPLSAGDLVLSGALGPMVDVHAGDRVDVEIEGFSPIRLRFDE